MFSVFSVVSRTVVCSSCTAVHACSVQVYFPASGAEVTLAMSHKGSSMHICLHLSEAAWRATIGDGVGDRVGAKVGAKVGASVGVGVGASVGAEVGANVGVFVGATVGAGVGTYGTHKG